LTLGEVALVTGSGGLIGSESVRHLCAQGLDVVGIENDMRSRFFGPEASTSAVTEELRSNLDGFRSEELDIRDAEGIERRGVILATLTKLKQVCNHPAQLLGDGSEVRGRSGKLTRLSEMLDELIDAGDRALVFTQFAEMGHLLQGHLQEALGEEVLYLHGGTPKRRRDAMVERFQAGGVDAPPVFVLSLKAGGTGLNLTGANHVFHFDRWWNPAVENQATDRAFRIGQTQNVQVHKYVCAGTLEERIDEMIESKRSIAENIVGTGENWITELSDDELHDIFALRKDAVRD
jgi:SNF2 family DNA or RNA helicase